MPQEPLQSRPSHLSGVFQNNRTLELRAPGRANANPNNAEISDLKREIADLRGLVQEIAETLTGDVEEGEIDTVEAGDEFGDDDLEDD